MQTGKDRHFEENTVYSLQSVKNTDSTVNKH